MRGYIDLVDYVATRWRTERGYPLGRTRARRLLEQGKINVNGSVAGYRDFPRDALEIDDLGRPRVMVEGMPDPRPAAGGLELGRRYRSKAA